MNDQEKDALKKALGIKDDSSAMTAALQAMVSMHQMTLQAVTVSHAQSEERVLRATERITALLEKSITNQMATFTPQAAKLSATIHGAGAASAGPSASSNQVSPGDGARRPGDFDDDLDGATTRSVDQVEILASIQHGEAGFRPPPA